MTLKQQIVRELGDAELLLPDQIARSLLANDAVKYYLALLQTARANADQPRVPAPDLKAERIACQLDDVWLDDVVAGSAPARAAKGRTRGYRIPHGPEILGRVTDAVDAMLACLPEAQRQPFVQRLDRLGPPRVERGVVPGELVDRMTSGDRGAGDSLHLVVMDVHRAINELQARTAPETLAGARVHNLSAEGRALVESFMAGLNRTAPLKFDHPGLGTTATEHGGRLLIQNDIGTTDAHVLVIRVQGSTATLTYTDIHRPRLKFFQKLLGGFAVSWEETDLRTSRELQSGSYLLATGTYGAADPAELRRYLEHVGSRIVFLIDWNRMRKRLRAFVDKEHAVAVLQWGADHELGHRGLIEVGGEHALAEAIEYAAGDRLRYGDRLDELIGPDNASAFLRHALEIASGGLRQRRSRRAILDEIKADLRRYFESARLAIFDIAARHAAYGHDLATALCDALDRLGGGDGPSVAAVLAMRAAAWEKEADRLLNLARDDVRRFERPRALLDFIEFADDAVDEMEEAASLVELAQLACCDGEALGALRGLAGSALASARELVKCVECAATVTRADVRDDLDDFLRCLEELVRIEHEADAQIRTIRRVLVAGKIDHRGLYLAHELSRALESATDAHAHAGQALRRYLMEEIVA
ncbi:MAG: DUF47 family protein [Alphaproteobacteria bacterium]|nr:DUF47 family protein [Alphaproteobacteria bacterium]